MPIGSVAIPEVVRHAIDYTLWNKPVNIPDAIKQFPGFLHEDQEHVKRISFITANGTNFRKEIPVTLFTKDKILTVYSTDPRIQTFNNLFVNANKQITDWGNTIRTYDYTVESLFPSLGIKITWIPIVGLAAFWIYVNRNDKRKSD